MTAIAWWPTETGQRRHAVPQAAGPKALCGLTPKAPWAVRRAPLVEAQCRNCLRGRKPMPVISSNVATLAHAANGELDVTFHNGGHYRYFGVPRAVYHQLLDAPSVGSALAQLVKDAGYRFTKFDPEIPHGESGLPRPAQSAGPDARHHRVLHYPGPLLPDGA